MRKSIGESIAVSCKILLAYAMAMGSAFAVVAICCVLLLITCVVMVTIPAAYIDSERFAPPSQELVEPLTPYLYDWLTISPEHTRTEREQVGSRLDVQISIDTATDEVSGDTFPIVNILAENWNAWRRGFLYTDRAVDLSQVRISRFYGNAEVRRLNGGWYVYNYKVDS